MSTILAEPEPDTATTHIPESTSNHELQSPRNDGRWPDWFVSDQEAAWNEYLATPAPGRRAEEWRFSNVKALDFSSFRTPADASNPDAIALASKGVKSPAAKFIFANNRLVAKDAEGLPSGVIALPLEEAAEKHPGLFRAYFMNQPVELGSHKYALLHRSQLQSGFFLYVPKGTVIENPIEIFYWAEGDHSSVFPHTLVVCEENSQVKVLDYFGSFDGKPALACGVNDLHAGPGSNLQYFAIQNWSPESLAFHLNSTIVGKDASATALSMNFGGKFIRGESLSRMAAEGARSEMLSINPISGSRMIDQRTLQQHDAPGATSDLLYHNTLDDSARSIFSGLIKVEQGAHRTDAYQKVRNILLSDEAEANSMPGLEILADDVRCTHGATSGEVSEEELFYMEARGIPKTVGRRMVIMGFFDSLLERIRDGELRDYLSAQVRGHLGLRQ